MLAQNEISRCYGSKLWPKLKVFDTGTESQTDRQANNSRGIKRFFFKMYEKHGGQQQQEGQHIGATYKSILKVLLKQYRSPTDPNKFMGSKCMKFHDHRLITESVIVRKPFSNNHAP